VRRQSLVSMLALGLAAGCDAGRNAEVSEPASPESAQAPTPSATPGDASPAEADEPDEPDEPDPLTLGPDASTSVGTPVEGRLEGSVALPLTGPGWRFNPRKKPERRHGTVELVQALVRAASAVQEEMPGNTLTISDIAMPEGGPIKGHASHRSGRDVDVFFYLSDPDGKPFDAKAIPIEPDGTGVDYHDLTTADDDEPVRLDVPRTWKFIEALVSQGDVRINRIFVVEHIRSMLLTHAKRIGAPKEVRTRFGHLACQPQFPHDDHFHIRFYCSPDDIAAGCEDTKPFYPWHLAYLKEEGATIQLAGKRETERPKLTSVEKAAAKKKEEVGAFDPAVDSFLERRKAWAKKPHPGRKYCK
jgi:penicillin-insensitive murein endopeptidase